MSNRLEKFKAHIQENKKVYIGTTIGIVVGIAASAFVFKSSSLVNAKPIQVLTWKSKQTIEVFIEALGDPGNIIQDMTTGTIYASQGQAARELDLNPSAISKHLNGLTPHVKGHLFEKLGKATTSV